MTLYWSCVNHATFALEVYYHKIICCQEKPERLNCILFSIWNTKTSNILQFGIQKQVIFCNLEKHVLQKDKQLTSVNMNKKTYTTC